MINWVKILIEDNFLKREEGGMAMLLDSMSEFSTFHEKNLIQNLNVVSADACYGGGK